MKHIKRFEDKEDDEQMFQDLFDENPISKTHDFYMFIGRDDFIENEDGSYRKSLEIENMVRMTKKNVRDAGLMELRTRFQGGGSQIYHIWLPIEIRDEVDGKGTGSMEPWLIDLINKHKEKGGDEHSREVYKDVKQRREDMNKYNL